MTDVTDISARAQPTTIATQSDQTQRGNMTDTLATPEAQFVYSVQEAAELLRIGYSTIREEIRTGQLQSFKVGRRRLVTGEALVNYVREREGGFHG